jgi:paraquat-inducible protein A
VSFESGTMPLPVNELSLTPPRQHVGADDFVEPSLRATIECPNCGLAQVCGERTPNHKIICCRCRTVLAHFAAKSLDATFACAIAILLLLIPALTEPFLTTSIFGATRTSTLPMSAFVLWQEGWPLLAIVVFLFLLLFPIVRFGALAVVLLAIRRDRRPRWLGFAFRVSNTLQTWAMLDVFLLGFGVAYARLHASLLVTLDIGAVCFMVATVLSLVSRATLDKARAWQRIAPDSIPRGGESMIACRWCSYWVPQDQEGCCCPRCGAIVRHRRPNSIPRAIALLIAAIVLYFPANLYPIATIPIDFKPTSYTVLGGIVDLTRSGLLGLALIVFCASFTIPLLKMAGLAWCVTSTVRRSTTRLIAKTRVYRVIEEIGRWSMVDPLTIACFVPVLHFNGFVNGSAEAAATPFAAVVILTTLAVKFFDPRLMWDAAEAQT